MIVIDANLLIYAYHSGTPAHAPARAWLEKTFSGPDPVRLAWSTIHAFLRITTHPAVFSRPFSIDEVASVVDEWLHLPNLGILEPAEQYWAILRSLLGTGQIRGDLVMDAHLAALTIEHGGTLYTTDRDFSRFRELRVVNPLE